MTQVPIPDNQLGTMQMMREVSEHVTMNCLEVPDSRYVAQPIHDVDLRCTMKFFKDFI